MKAARHLAPIVSLFLASVCLAENASSDRDVLPRIAFAFQDQQLAISIGGKPFAVYVHRDEQIRRPYFAHVHAPNGLQVTRNHPPVEKQDRTDHATFHPGIWQAFGDINGGDFWRNLASVQHVKFLDAPTDGDGRGHFAVVNRYEADGKLVCEETCRFEILVRPAGYLLIWDSTFRSSTSRFTFGDQEEMGLGLRVATPISVESGGQILNSDGLKNGKQAWGKQADWCDYFGLMNGHPTGIMLMPDPANFRRCWFHARDYGLLVANAFGKNAFTNGEKSRVVVKKGQELRTRYGVLIHGGDDHRAVSAKDAYRDFLDHIRPNR